MVEGGLNEWAGLQRSRTKKKPRTYLPYSGLSPFYLLISAKRGRLQFKEQA